VHPLLGADTIEKPRGGDAEKSEAEQGEKKRILRNGEFRPFRQQKGSPRKTASGHHEPVVIRSAGSVPVSGNEEKRKITGLKEAAKSQVTGVIN